MCNQVVTFPDMTETDSLSDRPWSFVHITDIHIGSERSYRFNPAWNENWATAARQIRELKPDLLLVGGDIARDGNFHDWELNQSCAALDAVGVPWHVIPGNMDTGNKITAENGPHSDRDDVACNVTEESLERFSKLVRPSPWSFLHRGVRFSGFYEILTDTGLPYDLAARHWLKDLVTLPPTQWHIMLNHYPLFVHEPDEIAYDLADQNHYHD